MLYVYMAIILAVVCPRLDFSLLPRCLQIVWCHVGPGGVGRVISQGKICWNTPSARATKKTDSAIHSFSHWAIMTRAMERTDSEIHSFSHWAIMTRATKRTDSEIHSFFHWAIMNRGGAIMVGANYMNVHVSLIILRAKQKLTSKVASKSIFCDYCRMDLW